MGKARVAFVLLGVVDDVFDGLVREILFLKGDVVEKVPSLLVLDDLPGLPGLVFGNLDDLDDGLLAFRICDEIVGVVLLLHGGIVAVEELPF